MMGLQNLPSVDEVLKDARVREIENRCARDLVVQAVRDELGILREGIMNAGHQWNREEARERVVIRAIHRLEALRKGSLRRIINATGVVLHTNLGRAPLSPESSDYVARLAQGYTNLEMDLEEGKRGSRYQHLESMLQSLSGAEAALVVNNNAAAVLLVLNTLATGCEVVVSRGQLVEIGGSFRIPEIMALSGARLVEVGTTNKTYLSDFEQAVTEQTALFLAVHTSNYRIVGFTHEVALNELVDLGRRLGLPVVQDLGSGSLIDLSSWGLEAEPTVQECLQTGVDLVTFSGDKLLGGPQAGIIVGKKHLIDAMKRNHLLRALRVDKLTIAGLEATLSSYINGCPQNKIPVLRMLTRDPAELKELADGLARSIRDELQSWSEPPEVRVVEINDKVGGGAYPLQELPGYGVEMVFGFDPGQLVHRLRIMEPALLPRIKEGAIIISVRTLQAGEEKLIPGLLRHGLEAL
ncbi:MAG: L-seryl-tRNA(Sec) selenium transferase [Bacillota bacterium]